MKFLLMSLFITSQAIFADPFRISSYNDDGSFHEPSEFAQNMTSKTGAEYARHPSAELLAKLENQANGKSEKAHFDIAVIYFLGLNVKSDNKTALNHFRESYKLPKGLDVASSNANQIHFGPVRRKDWSDLSQSIGRAVDKNLIWARDWLLYFQSKIFG